MKYYGVRTNYIILNGKSSATIPGLLISTLPSITKPKIRTEVEEIDGRDGDIITTLGYSAYDKEFSIGLHGQYDVDKVIKYFDSEGTVTFSNERDKYYKYQITEQIDFERLLRFKTAEVKMHVQPFKYSLEDNKRTFNISGESSITIRNAGNIYSKPKITIYGSGMVYLTLNGVNALALNIDNNEYITIDTAEMEAYKGNTLLNRYVSGDYNDLYFQIGKNILSWTGSITKIVIEDYSRWI